MRLTDPLPVRLTKQPATGYDDARYAVSWEGKPIGYVSKHHTPSYRSDGTTSRIQWGYRGQRRFWEAERLSGELHDRKVGHQHETRRGAVQALVVDWARRQPEDFMSNTPTTAPLGWSILAALHSVMKTEGGNG